VKARLEACSDQDGKPVGAAGESMEPSRASPDGEGVAEICHQRHQPGADIVRGIGTGECLLFDDPSNEATNGAYGSIALLWGITIVMGVMIIIKCSFG